VFKKLQITPNDAFMGITFQTEKLILNHFFYKAVLNLMSVVLLFYVCNWKIVLFTYCDMQVLYRIVLGGLVLIY